MSKEYLQQYAPGIKIVSQISVQTRELKKMERELDQVCSLINTVQNVKKDVENAGKILEAIIDVRKDVRTNFSWFAARRKKKIREKLKQLATEYNHILSGLQQSHQFVSDEYNLDDIEYVVNFSSCKRMQYMKARCSLHTKLATHKEKLKQQIDIAEKSISELKTKMLSANVKTLGDAIPEPKDWEKYMTGEEWESYQIVMQANNKDFSWATSMFQRKLVLSSLMADNNIKIIENKKSLDEAKNLSDKVLESVKNLGTFQDYRGKQHSGVGINGIREEVKLAQAARALRELVGGKGLAVLDERVKSGATKSDAQLAKTVIDRLVKKCGAESLADHLSIESSEKGIMSKLQEAATKLAIRMEMIAKEGQELIELGEILNTASSGIDRCMESVGVSMEKERKKRLRDQENFFQEGKEQLAY